MKTPDPRPGRQGGRIVSSDARTKYGGSFDLLGNISELSSGGRNQRVSACVYSPTVTSEASTWAWIAGAGVHRSNELDGQRLSSGHGVRLFSCNRTFRPASRRSSGTIKSMDLELISIESLQPFIRGHSYSNNRRHAVKYQEVVSPKDTGNLG